jgi:threonine/homoserine/homoserine lactone efflux protein
VPTTATIAAFAAASFAIIIIPGPAVLFIINRSVADGRRVGLASVAGIELGSFVHVLAATLGLSAIIATSAVAFTVVKVLGAGYLILTGIRTLLTRPAPIDTTRPAVAATRAFRQGVLVNILNPKVALFFLSFLPQFIDTGRGSAATQALILGTVFCLVGFLSDGAYAMGASALRGVLLRGRSLPFVQRYVAGSVFIGLGVVAATTGQARTSG